MWFIIGYFTATIVTMGIAFYFFVHCPNRLDDENDQLRHLPRS
jgi:hypothetical protein